MTRRPPARRSGPLALLVAGTVLLAACTWHPPEDAGSGASPEAATNASPGAGEPDTEPSAGSTAGSDPVASPAPPAPPAPPRRACYRLRTDELTEPTSGRPPVPCRSRHTAVTIHVGQVDTVVDGHAVAIDSRHVTGQLAAACPRRLARFLGGSAEDLALSRFEVAWFSPTVEQSDAGATWYRCDVVAFGVQARLLSLPPPRALAGVLSSESGRDRFGLCGSTAPGSPGFRRVVCSTKHAWRAIATIPLEGRRRYPGEAAVRQAGDGACRDAARRASGSPDEFRYGWEWPTRPQWQAAQHFGYCWIPD